MTDPNIGRKVSNRYELIETIGRGSMGKVYLAGDSLLGGVPVAVKFLSQALLNEDMRQRFFREAMTCAQLGQKSMHVVRVTDYGVNEDDIPFYVMEYLQGENVGQLIQKQPLPIPRFMGLIRQILLGLRTAHNGILVKGKVVPIIHRDIKPSNILVTSDPSMGELVKILDFGIAKLLQAGCEQTSTFMGTLAYASPEQMEGRELDSRSDIYSLGVMMYQMLSSNLPVKPANNTFGSWYKVHRLSKPKSLVDCGVPPALNKVVMDCLAKQREARPASIDDIIEAIEPLEKRFGSGFHISQRINAALSKFPDVEPEAPSLIDESRADAAVNPKELPYLSQMWPEEMPVARIVFPKLLTIESEILPTLWAMLPTAEIQARSRNTRYNNFMCTLSPHPMVLWLTALYSKQQGPRWLPCYLDLKTAAAQTVLWELANRGQYRMLFFSEESPHSCVMTKSVHVANSQIKLLRDWATQARGAMPIGNPQESKGLLKDALETNLKPKILMNFEAMHAESHPKSVQAPVG